MAQRPRWIPYRRGLTSRARTLRRDPSPAEKKLWYEFLRGLDYKFTRQKLLGRYVADFYCASQRLVIELDGDSHYTDQALRYDAARTEALELLGIRVIRFTNLEVVQDFEAVCEIVVAALKGHPAP
jgi:very-short-patch-repair endonuclease